MSTSQNNEVLAAEAILFGPNGSSINSATTAITVENIDEYAPSRESIQKATKILESIGFQVLDGFTSLTLTAAPSVFERAFRVKIEVDNDGNFDVSGEVIVPVVLRPYVDTVLFPSPYEYF